MFKVFNEPVIDSFQTKWVVNCARKKKANPIFKQSSAGFDRSGLRNFCYKFW